MDEFKQDIKEIKSDVSSIKIDVARNTIALEHHIKRTDLAEERIDYIQEHVVKVQTIWGYTKLIAAAIAGTISIVWTVLQIVKLI